MKRRGFLKGLLALAGGLAFGFKAEPAAMTEAVAWDAEYSGKFSVGDTISVVRTGERMKIVHVDNKTVTIVRG